MTDEYTPEDVSQFVSEFVGRAAEYREQRKAWQSAMDAQKLLKVANDPHQVTQAYAGDPTKAPDRLIADAALEVLGGFVPIKDEAQLGAMAENIVGLRRSQFTTELEAAYTEHREDIPLEWWMQWNEADIRLFGTPEMAPIADHLNEVQDLAAREEEYLRAIEEETERRYRARQNRGMFGWLKDTAQDLVGMGMTGRGGIGAGDAERDRRTRNEIRAQVERDFRDPTTQYDDRIADYMTTAEDRYRRAHTPTEELDPNMAEAAAARGFAPRTVEDFTEEGLSKYLEEEEARVRQQIAAGGDAGDILEFKGLIHHGIDGVLGVIPWGLDKVDRGLEGILWGIEGLTPGSGTYDTLRAEYNLEQQQIRASMDTMSGRPDEELIREVRFMPLRDAWDAMPLENPEQYDVYMQMAGFDPTMAFAFFGADVSEDPEASEQMAEMVEMLRESERKAIEDFEAADFKVSGKLLDMLASYGRNVPGRLSTYFSLFLSDGDYFDDAIHGRWGEFFTNIEQESEYFGHTPSAALGIDGSLSGLMLDLGSGIAFDPATWLFGPRGAVSTLKGSTFAEAKAIARSPVVRQFVNDAANIVRSPSKGIAELLHVSSWGDSRFVGEIMDIVGWNKKQLPAQPWRATAGAEAAMEVETKFLRFLIPDEVVASIPEAELVALSDDILANGFKNYTSTTITRGDQMLFLDDGAKRVLAAEHAGISHVPARLNIVDDFAARPTNLIDEAVTPDVQRRMVDLGNKTKARTDLDPVVEIEMADGSMLTIRDIGSTQRPGVFAYVDDVSVGGLHGDELGVLSKYSGSAKEQLMTADGRTVAQVLVDTADTAGYNPLQTLAASDSISQSAYSFLKKEADRLGQTLPFDSPQGTALDAFMKDRTARKQLKGAGAGDVITRPDQFFPREMLLGQLDESALRAATERAILRGNVPDGAYRSAISTHWNAAIRKAARTNTGTKWVERYMTPQNTVRRIEVTGSRALDRIYDTTFRIWGDDTLKVDAWQSRFMDYQRTAQTAQRVASERLKSLAPMRQQLDALLDQIGGSPYEPLKTIKGAAGTQARNARKALQKEYDELLRKFEKEYASIDKILSEQANSSNLARLVEDMWDDYNRTYIATNPLWASKVDDVTGLVPWEELKKGSLFKRSTDDAAEGVRNFLAEDMKATAKDLGINAEQMVQRLSSTLDQTIAVNVDVSPLELTLAREMGAAAYTRHTQQIAGALARDTFHGMNNAWKIDKVFRPATAVTVSWDELMRDMHVFGARQGFLRWQQDRALFMRARASHLLQNGGNPFSRQAVRKGVTQLSAKSRARVQALADYPTYLKAAERQLHDGNGLGWTDIPESSGQYLEAAQRWTGGMLQDSGFRAFLRGREAFKEWFFSSDGETVRKGIALAKDETGSVGTRLLRGADEAFDGWTTLFEKIILKTAKDRGKFDDVLEAFRSTANKIDEAGGVAHELPSVVFDNLGPIRGVKKELGVKHPVAALTETFFDTWFMDPVNYRRGLVAEQVRAGEMARLKRLFISQNKQIIPDMELERMLGLKGLGGGTRSGLKDMLYDAAWDKGFVPQGYLDDLVERTVESEIDNMLYTWDRSSRVGAQSTALFPFGKPWADMAGFWGREVMRKPMLRGAINQKNLLGMRTLYDNVPMPFNPKPAAMMSRLAHTDFTIDKGLHPSLPGQFGEGGLLPGSDETDFSPLFFLPTGGDNPFGAILPGLGYIPMGFLDKVLTHIADPVDDPVRYQELVDQVGDFIPSARYQAGTGVIPRMLGGGTMGTMASLAVDAATFINHEPEFAATTLLGDISRELDRTRELSALLADPEEFEDLLAAGSPEDVETLLMSLAHEADNRVAGSHAAETVARFLVPASNQYDTSLHEIFDVWVDAAGQFPSLGVRPSLANADLEDPDLRRQYANDVRSAFFDLPSWERDLYIAMQPSLAVNLVGSWDWTAAAKQAGIEGTDTVYRSIGTSEGLAQHQAYVDAGYIRPVVPLERAKRIIGMMQASKEKAAKYIYETEATAINNFLFDNLSDDTLGILESVLANEQFMKDWAIVDARDLWNNWSSMEQRIEEAYASQVGVEPIRGNDDYERIRDMVKIPADEKPWGSSWPGLDDEELSARFRNVSFNFFSPETEQIAAGLGIDLTPGMNGLQLFTEIQEVITEVDSPLYSTVRVAYDHYIGEKGIGARAAEAELSKAKINPDLDEEWRNGLAQWQVRADRLADQYSNAVGGVPLDVARETAQEFGNFVATTDLNIAWDDIWTHKYSRTFGPLEWEPPQPQPAVVDGQRQPGTVVPYIKHVSDGDTIVFQERRGAEELRTVRLLGVNARDYGLDDDGAAEDQTRLQDALQKAVDEGATIYLVRDPLFGDTDHYGRMLAWLWIGDEPFYFEDEMRSTVTPSESDR